MVCLGFTLLQNGATIHRRRNELSCQPRGWPDKVAVARHLLAYLSGGGRLPGLMSLADLGGICTSAVKIKSGSLDGDSHRRRAPSPPAASNASRICAATIGTVRRGGPTKSRPGTSLRNAYRNAGRPEWLAYAAARIFRAAITQAGRARHD